MLVFKNPLHYLGQYEHHNFCLEVEGENFAVSRGHAHVLGSSSGKWHSPKYSPASVWLWCKAGNNIKGCYYVTAPMKGPAKTSWSWSCVPDWDLPEVTGGSVGGFGWGPQPEKSRYWVAQSTSRCSRAKNATVGYKKIASLGENITQTLSLLSVSSNTQVLWRGHSGISLSGQAMKCFKVGWRWCWGKFWELQGC